MSSYVITCESTADRSREFLASRAIPYVCFHYEMDGTTYVDDIYESTTPQAFFGALKAGAQSKTSQVSTGEYIAFWEPYLAEGKDVLHLTLSSGISGTYNSACLAAEQLRERFPERKLVVIDSLNASSGYGMLMEYLADLRDEGMGFDELCAWAEDRRLDVNSWFFVSDLDCLKRGGRVSSTSAMLATALKICPVLTVDAKGALAPREKIRLKKKAIAKIVDKMRELAEGGSAYDGKCVIVNSNAREDAEATRDLVVTYFPQLEGKIAIENIGTVIGSHTGPGTVALFFMGARRCE